LAGRQSACITHGLLEFATVAADAERHETSLAHREEGRAKDRRSAFEPGSLSPFHHWKLPAAGRIGAPRGRRCRMSRVLLLADSNRVEFTQGANIVRGDPQRKCDSGPDLQ
jgi:hypothetical protein